MTEADIENTMLLLNKLQPHQIYCAGDFADPHGTHKVCFDVVIESLKRLKIQHSTSKVQQSEYSAEDSWLNNCWLWLYKGAWQEWDITEIEMAVPMSPDQVIKKRNGIFIHQSQKDTIPFQGSDNREFWQRAEERNANTARLYGQLGLTQYAAMEAFVRFLF
jgi:glucosamine-6-phosphate deaminase